MRGQRSRRRQRRNGRVVDSLRRWFCLLDARDSGVRFLNAFRRRLSRRSLFRNRGAFRLSLGVRLRELGRRLRRKLGNGWFPIDIVDNQEKSNGALRAFGLKLSQLQFTKLDHETAIGASNVQGETHRSECLLWTERLRAGGNGALFAKKDWRKASVLHSVGINP